VEASKPESITGAARLSYITQGFRRRLTTTVIKGVLIWAFLLVPFDLSDSFKNVG
jgi:hypothetical protein